MRTATISDGTVIEVGSWVMWIDPLSGTEFHGVVSGLPDCNCHRTVAFVRYFTADGMVLCPEPVQIGLDRLDR